MSFRSVGIVLQQINKPYGSVASFVIPSEGRNGIKNIIAHLGTQEFPRIKVGVGDKPPRMDLADYVLSRFSKEDREKMEQAFKDAAEAVEVMIAEGPDAAMNQFNGHK